MLSAAPADSETSAIDPAMPTVLITGSSGFVGGRASEFFRASGWQTIGIGRRQTVQANYFRFDLTRPLSEELVKRLSSVDVVIHAAAHSSPWGSKRKYELANVVATENMLRACGQAGHPKFVFVSSSSVYYEPRDQFDIDESTPLSSRPVNQYAATKQIAEQRVREYQGEWVILRPRAVYGAGDTVLFPRILKAAQAGKLPLLTRPGEPAVGDLISIDNLVDCLFQAANDANITGEFNLTDQQPREILGFLLNVFQRLNIQPPSRELSVKTAFRVARVIEVLYQIAMPWREPPITRFGVHVFAYSKTFDVRKMVSAFGPPKQSTDQAVEAFVTWVRKTDPYGLRPS